MKVFLFVLVFINLILSNINACNVNYIETLPQAYGNKDIIDISYHDIEITFVSEKKVAIGIKNELSIINIDSSKYKTIKEIDPGPFNDNVLYFRRFGNEKEGLLLYRYELNNDFLFDTKTGKQYRLNDPEDRAEILAAPEEVFRSFRYSYEGDNYEGFARNEPFRIYRTDNYTLEEEVIWEAPVQEIFPGITFNAESHILDISEDGKNVLVSVGGGDKGSIFVADFDGTGLSNAREIMYDYVPDAVFVGNEYAVVPFDRMAVGTEGNGLWRLGIYDFDGNQVAVVEDVWVGDSINQFDVDEDGNQLVLVGIYKDEVGVYLFDIVR